MNVHDKAYELARAIKESSEFKEMRQVKQQIDADSDSKRMLDDFRARQVEMQQKMMAGETPSTEDMQKMEKLYEVISLNPAIRRLFDAERRLSVTVEDVQRIIAEPLQEVLN